ncbi:transposase [Planctomycetales bacterium]|nr:transposase [Planctomycetales bacterium]GHT06320.1 transposase [Planctomycetales bacterium]
MSYVQLLYHVVIRTKYNRPVLSIEHSDHLYRYIWGIIKNNGGVLYRINGVADHLHFLASLPPTVALADFMRDLKAETSKMLKRTAGFAGFTAWSEGYAALSYSLSDKNTIVNYIRNQREHHRQQTFKEEFEEMLEKMGLKLNPRDWER